MRGSDGKTLEENIRRHLEKMESIEELSEENQFFCRSFFPKEKKDYTIGQPQFTLLFKEKITVSTGEKVIQYDRLTPKSDSAKISLQENPKKGKAE